MQNSTPSLAKGMAATVLVIAVALAIVTRLPPDTLTGMASLILVAMVPSQVVISLFWRCQYPVALARLPQPWAGVGFCLLTLLAGAIIAPLVWQLIGGGLLPVNPFAIMYLITSVPITVMLVVVFQGWPCSRTIPHQGLAGLAILLLAYAINTLVFYTLFNFGFARQAPFYHAQLDPGGLLMAWLPLIASLTMLVFILLLVVSDFWPVAWLAAKLGVSNRQPWFGLLTLACIAVIGAVLWALGLGWAQMPLLAFMVRVCVSEIFGLFILLVMLQGVPSLTLPQPWRGLLLAVVSALLAILMFALYRWVAARYFQISATSPDHLQELWIASAMLSVTFPLMVTFANYFGLWPLVRATEAHHTAEPAETAEHL